MASFNSQGNGFQNQSSRGHRSNYQNPAILTQRPASPRHAERNSPVIPSSTKVVSSGSPQRVSQALGTVERIPKRPRHSTQPSREGLSPVYFGVFTVDSSITTTDFVGPPSMATVDFRSSEPAREVEHGPTDLPPRQYVGGKDAVSPFKRKTQAPSVPASAVDELPKVENRLVRLENAIQRVLVIRGEEALERSVVPGLEDDDDDEEY